MGLVRVSRKGSPSVAGSSMVNLMCDVPPTQGGFVYVSFQGILIGYLGGFNVCVISRYDARMIRKYNGQF